MRIGNVLRNGLRPSAWTSPAVFGLAAWLCFPTEPARGDLADLLFGRNGAESWRMVLTDSPAGSIHAAELSLPGLRMLASGPKGVTLPDGRRIALNDGQPGTDAHATAVPDENRVNRAGKKGRIIAVSPMQPPRAFSAGSVLERQSSLLLPPAEGKTLASLLRHGAEVPEIELAAFHFRREEAEEDRLLPAVAELVNGKRQDILALAYAPSAPDFARQSPFDAILRDETAGRFIPPVGPADHAWLANPLPADTFTAQEQKCLAEGIYFEARGEPARGQAAVAQVILNRVRNPAFPKSICGVVYQNSSWRNRCQFSFACDHLQDRVRSQYHWKLASQLGAAVSDGRIWISEVGSATHYHTIRVRPKWAAGMVKLGRIGLHVFYRTHRGGWS